MYICILFRNKFVLQDFYYALYMYNIYIDFLSLEQLREGDTLFFVAIIIRFNVTSANYNIILQP